MKHINQNNGNSTIIENVTEIFEKSDILSKNKEFAQKLKDLKDEYKVDFDISITFPQYNILPEEVRLATIILNNHKARLAINLKERKDDNS